MIMLAAAAILGASAPDVGEAGGGSYAKILDARTEKRFYGAEARPWLGRNVHLHVPLDVFTTEPGELEKANPRLARGRRILEQRGVPLVVVQSNPSYRQFLRKTRRRATGDVACVKGKVVMRSLSEGRRAVVLIHTVSRIRAR